MGAALHVLEVRASWRKEVGDQEVYEWTNEEG